MSAHLYVCDVGGPMVVATEGAPPRWVTCPDCAGFECCKCPGALLQGDAPDFTGGSSRVYRCEAGHEQTLRFPADMQMPESAQCSRCDGLMLPVHTPTVQH
jgi:hypothetical protein